MAELVVGVVAAVAELVVEIVAAVAVVAAGL